MHKKNCSPPIPLYGSSVLILLKWGPQWAQQKTAAAVQQGVELDSIFAKTQPDVTLQWPITHMQVHIPGGLLGNMNALFICLPRQHRD